MCAAMSAQINEKTRTKRAPVEMARLLHGIFGMEHYHGARYLNKLSPDALLALENGLRAQLGLVEAARALREPLPPAAAPPSLDSPLLRELAAPVSPRTTGAVLRHVHEEAPGVFSFDLLDHGACEGVIEAVTRLAPSSDFDRASVSLRATPELHALETALRTRVVAPLAAILFPEFTALHDSYAFVVGYAPTPTGPLLDRTALVPHTDDAEVTLNVCLGRDFAGGDLILRGLRGTEEGEVIVPARPGRAILHRGQHLHEVSPITGGTRFALVLWARDPAYRARTCPCCLIHRRSGACVCDPSLN
jgi:hypothetical protein